VRTNLETISNKRSDEIPAAFNPGDPTWFEPDTEVKIPSAPKNLRSENGIPPGQRVPLAAFANTTVGHQKFVRWATKGGHSARVCLEATGIYSLEFALALCEAKRVELMMVNPRAIKDFAGASMQRAKTDAVDAGVMLDFLHQREALRTRVVLDREIHQQVFRNRMMDQVVHLLGTHFEALRLCFSAVDHRWNAPGGAQLLDSTPARQRAERRV